MFLLLNIFYNFAISLSAFFSINKTDKPKTNSKNAILIANKRFTSIVMPFRDSTIKIIGQAIKATIKDNKLIPTLADCLTTAVSFSKSSLGNSILITMPTKETTSPLDNISKNNNRVKPTGSLFAIRVITSITIAETTTSKKLVSALE